MFPERLWAAFRFVPWEDTFCLHARLFRCFLLGFLDANSELAFVSRGPERMWAVLGQRLADAGLGRDAGHLHEHEPVSHRARCPPKRRYEATSSPSFVTNPPVDQTVPVPPPFVPQPIHNNNITRGLHDEFMRSAVAVDIPGSARVLGGYDGLVTVTGASVVDCLLLWLFTLAIVVLRSRVRSDSTRAVCRLPRVAMDSTTNSGERVIRRLLWDHLPVGHGASMPGAWLFERREQSTLDTLEESVLDTVPVTLYHSCALMGIKVCTHVPGLTEIFAALDPLNRRSNDVVTIGRQSEDGRTPGLSEFNLDGGVSMPVALGGTEQLVAPPDRLPSEFGLSIRNLHDSTTAMHNRCEPSAISDVAIKVASSNADRGSYQEDMSSDGHESASKDGPDGGLFGMGTRRANERKDGYRGLGRRQDGALSDTGCPLSLRRARSTGYLWRKRDMFDDDDEGTDDDSYWTEQVNARLSDERDSLWTDGSSWPREGREDETDNWRTRSSQVTDVTAPEQCQVGDNSTKLRRYSSPSLNVNASLSHRAGSGDGSQGIYVVPQRRGSRCWSPVCSPRPPDSPSGLGFFPFRKMPSLLTPEAWRPGCLSIRDPPVDESRQADTWWDSLTRGAASAGGYTSSTGAETDDMPEQEPPFSRDGQDVPVSWRDKYENDPASRRIISIHRRAMTEG